MKLVVIGLLIGFSVAIDAHAWVGRKAWSDGASPQQNDERIIKILTNSVLWRKDFPSLLATLKNWNNAGEAKVSVFSNEAYGQRKFQRLDSQVSIETNELQALIANKPNLKPAFESTLASTWNESLTTVTAVGQPGRDDGTMRVALTSKTVLPPEFLAANLSMATVRQQSGEPDSVTTEIVDNGGNERRPVILTLYHYAGDAVVFAVSDMSPNPDLVDRAILDTRKISEAVFSNPVIKNKSSNNRK